MRASTRVAAWLLAALITTAPAHAEPSAGRAPEATATRGGSLRTRLGVEIAGILVKDADPEQRQRGFERLGNIGTTQALDLLLKAFESGGGARSARDRLIAVRALAEHAREPSVREFLVRIMIGVGTNPGRSEAVDRQIEDAAALALAATGDDAALAALGKALRQPGHVADTAQGALLAFPPRNLEPILQGGRSPTRALLEFLGALGDTRAIPALREIVRFAPNDLRPRAALALAQLGVEETVELARYWLKHESGPEFQSTAAHILLLFHAPDAADVVARRLDQEPNRATALELSSELTVPQLSGPLLRYARRAAPREQNEFAPVIALTGTREAFSFLGGALGAQETSSAAALALGLAPDPEAERTLEAALPQSRRRRAALRASLVRTVAQGRIPSGVAAALRAASRSNDVTDRALYAQFSAVLDPERASELLKHATLTALRAVARAAAWPRVAQALAERLARETDPDAREALAAGLISLEAAERVPSHVLLSLIEARGLGAPLAARALAARDSRILRPKITDLLESDDPLLRSHAALGLGFSSESSALGLLERAYRFEPDASVRLALVHALAQRSEPARERTLRLARALDGSPRVREAAIAALAGTRPEPEPAGQHTAWLDSSLADRKSGADRAVGALVISASGLAIPAFADPDGVLVLPGLPSSSFELRLAAPAGSDHAAVSKP